MAFVLDLGVVEFWALWGFGRCGVLGVVGFWGLWGCEVFLGGFFGGFGGVVGIVGFLGVKQSNFLYPLVTSYLLIHQFTISLFMPSPFTIHHQPTHPCTTHPPMHHPPTHAPPTHPRTTHPFTTHPLMVLKRLDVGFVLKLSLHPFQENCSVFQHSWVGTVLWGGGGRGEGRGG